jgi:hypothetical protein
MREIIRRKTTPYAYYMAVYQILGCSQYWAPVYHLNYFVDTDALADPKLLTTDVTEMLGNSTILSLAFRSCRMEKVGWNISDITLEANKRITRIHEKNSLYLTFCDSPLSTPEAVESQASRTLPELEDLRTSTNEDFSSSPKNVPR